MPLFVLFLLSSLALSYPGYLGSDSVSRIELRALVSSLLHRLVVPGIEQGQGIHVDNVHGRTKVETEAMDVVQKAGML